MNNDENGKSPGANPGGSGAKGGKDALKPEQQEPAGVAPDSIIDEKLRRSRRPEPGTLEPNTIVRN